MSKRQAIEEVKAKLLEWGNNCYYIDDSSESEEALDAILAPLSAALAEAEEAIRRSDGQVQHS